MFESMGTALGQNITCKMCHNKPECFANVNPQPVYFNITLLMVTLKQAEEDRIKCINTHPMYNQ